MQLDFIRIVAGTYTAPLNSQRELVLHRAVGTGTGWRLSIRDKGTRGFGTDLRLSAQKLADAQFEAALFAAKLTTL